MRNVVAGTRNPAKLAALRGLMAGVATVSAPPGDDAPGDEETGSTVPAVAIEKARGWRRWVSERGIADPVVVTDGGLLVPGLGAAWDPTRTRRFAGPGASTLEIARSMLLLTAHLSGEDRRIGWIEAAGVVFPGEEPVVLIAESPPGLLAETPREKDAAEQDGFWVPGVWLCPEFGMKRLIDLTPEERAARPDHWSIIGGLLRSHLGSPADPASSRSRTPG